MKIVRNSKLSCLKKNKYYVDLFLDYLKKLQYSVNTLLSYQHDLKQFLDFLTIEVCPLAKIKREQLTDFLIFLDSKTYNAKSIARKISSLKSFIHFLLKHRVISKSPLVLFNAPKVEKKLPAFLYEKEVDEMICQIPKGSRVEQRDTAIIEFLYSTGVRVSELVNAKLSDLSMVDQSIRVIGKGNKERVVFLTSRSMNSLSAYLTVRKEWCSNRNNKQINPIFLFIHIDSSQMTPFDVWKMVKSYSKKMFIQRNISPHSFRHSFATHLLNNGADIRSVQELLGHSSIASTQIYTYVSKEKLRQIYQDSHPHAD